MVLNLSLKGNRKPFGVLHWSPNSLRALGGGEKGFQPFGLFGFFSRGRLLKQPPLHVVSACLRQKAALYIEREGNMRDV